MSYVQQTIASLGDVNATAPSPEIIELAAQGYQNIQTALQKKIIGMEQVIEQLLIAIFSGNHALLIGVPGLAKTLLIRSVAELLDLKFSRIQFTPDLMPSDITGTEVLVYDEATQSREFTFLPGPLFGHIILADEINRTPPKTQSALLEAMEEKTVTALGKKFSLELPFLVLATQNPIEQEGTYPLPVAQLDRFMFNILVNYPSRAQEHRIMRTSLSLDFVPSKPILSRDQLLQIIAASRKIVLSDAILDYAVKLCRMARPQCQEAPHFVRQLIAYGPSPRALQNLIIAAKTRAMLQGRTEVIAQDIQEVAPAVLRHRILLHYRAEAENLTPDAMLQRLIEFASHIPRRK